MIVNGPYYTKTHEWIKIEGNIGIIGIADHAQEALGEVTFVELPELGTNVESQGELAVVESTKAASDVYSPIEGKIIEINESLEEEPEKINNDCYNDGWIVKIEISNTDNLKNLMTASEYKEFFNNEV